MREEIIKALLKLNHKDGGRLPSVRTLMQTYKVSSNTVQSALKQLEKDGKILKLQGKGCFWTGPEGAQDILSKQDIPVVRESAIEKLARLFKEDWERGLLKPNEPLPMSKELSQRYNVSQTVLRKFLYQQITQNVLTRQGRLYKFIQKKVATKQAPLSELIFVTRCNTWGGFNAESEREMDLLRMVYKKAGAGQYKLILLGIHETSGTIIDRSGKTCKLSDYPNAVGAILSTLLVMDPNRLLQIFANVKYPVAVWWEHPAQALPSRYLHKPYWGFFNSTFGSVPGLELGKYLQSRGFRRIAYISPYHNSSWSIDRLEGLRKSGLDVIESTDSEYASPWDYRQVARKTVPKHSVEMYARELLKKKLKEIIKESDIQLPLVCVNDEVASVLIEMEEEGSIKISNQIFGFDNSAESYLLRLSSYDFNTQALIDQMFYYIENPDNLNQKKEMHQILGQVIEK